MRLRRRPRFALVLVLIALPVIALLLAVHPIAGSGNHASSGPKTACLSTRATASTTLNATVRAQVKVSYPVRVTEKAQHGGAIVSVTRSATVYEQSQVQRPVSVRTSAVVPARACAQGDSLAAAKGAALERARNAALASAQTRAKASARRRVKALVKQFKPGQEAEARALGTARAKKVAAGLEPSLARKALAEAQSEALNQG